MKNSNSNSKVIIFYILLIVAIISATAVLFGNMNDESVSYSDIVQLFEKEQVKYFEINNSNYLNLVTQDGHTYTYRLRDVSIFYNDLNSLIREQLDSGILVGYNYEEPVEIPWWVSLLPYAFIIILFIVMWIFVMKQATGGGGVGGIGKISSFGKAKAKQAQDEKNKVLFKDVAGADEEKEELADVVEFLRAPDKFNKLGARIPHGVLLVGPPGTGKTLLAKAVAGEAGVPFFSISGSDFVEMYVGVGASRVRDLFDTARKAPASIIFIDEIDAVGRHRGAGLGGGHDEREQTLNQLLVEMDGFGSGTNIIVIAATNRPDILDPALLRPGRFDRQVTVNYPDIQGRVDILKVHAKNKPFEQTVDLQTVAKGTVGFTGADLANLLNEAALLAAKRGKSLIGMNDIEDSMTKILVGPQKKKKVINEAEKRLTAYHEAGHAIVTHILTPDNPVHQISIIPAGTAGGYTLSLPKEDKSYNSRTQMENEIVTLLGGRVAEKLILGDISTGASNDISRATTIARNMVTKYGMSDELGPIVYGSQHSDDEVFLGRDFSSGKNYSEETAAKIDSEIKAIVENAYDKCVSVLSQHIDKLHYIAGFLFRSEIMDEGQFNVVMDREPLPTYDELDAMKSEQRRRSEEENAIQERRNAEEKAKREDEEKAKQEAAKNQTKQN